jgi:hypothetical protein
VSWWEKCDLLKYLSRSKQCEIKTFVFFLLFFIKYNYLNCYPPPRNNDYVSRNCLSYHGHTCTWALHLPGTMALCQLNVSDTIALYLPEPYIYLRQRPCVNTKSVVPLPHTSPRQGPCVNKILGSVEQWYHWHFVDTWTFSRGSVAQWLHWPFVDTWTLSRGSVAQWYHWHFVETWTLYLPEPYIYLRQRPCVNTKSVVPLPHTSPRQGPCVNKISV